jgi:hypothetical protein
LLSKVVAEITTGAIPSVTVTVPVCVFLIAIKSSTNQVQVIAIVQVSLDAIVPDRVNVNILSSLSSQIAVAHVLTFEVNQANTKSVKSVDHDETHSLNVAVTVHEFVVTAETIAGPAPSVELKEVVDKLLFEASFILAQEKVRDGVTAVSADPDSARV